MRNQIVDTAKSLYLLKAVLNETDVVFKLPNILRETSFTQARKNFVQCLSKASTSDEVLACLERYKKEVESKVEIAQSGIDKSAALANNLLFSLALPGVAGLWMLYASVKTIVEERQLARAKQLERLVYEHIKMVALSILEKVEKYNIPRSLVVMDEMLKRGFIAGYKTISDEDTALVYLNVGLLKAFSEIKNFDGKLEEKKALLKAYLDENPLMRLMGFSELKAYIDFDDFEKVLDSVRYKVLREFVCMTSLIPTEDEYKANKLNRDWWFGFSYYKLKPYLNYSVRDKLKRFLQSIDLQNPLSEETAKEFLRIRFILSVVSMLDIEKENVSKLVDELLSVRKLSGVFEEQVKRLPKGNVLWEVLNRALEEVGENVKALRDLKPITDKMENLIRSAFDKNPIEWSKKVAKEVFAFPSFEPFKNLDLSKSVIKDGDYVFACIAENLTDLERSLTSKNRISVKEYKKALDIEDYAYIVDSVRTGLLVKKELDQDSGFNRNHGIYGLNIKP